MSDSLRGRDFIAINDLTNQELADLLDYACELKRRGSTDAVKRLRGRTLGLLFQKPSLRTRVSFEVAMAQLGGTAVYLSPAEVGMGEREAVDDVALVVSRYFDVLAARVFGHEIVCELAEHASIPVINALSDGEHPCQALADLLTILEWRGPLAGRKVVFVGDGNNVAASLALACAKTGMHFVCATPPGYELPEDMSARFASEADGNGASYAQSHDPREAAQNANIFYTDVWTSMGQEVERERRRRDFQGFCIDAELMSLGDDPIVLHCLPAHYGEEIMRDVTRGPRSAIWDQAENRMHAQKALLARIVE